MTMANVSQITAPIINQIVNDDAPGLLLKHVRRGLVGEIEVRPGEQPHMSLGNYIRPHLPKGFSIGLTPEVQPDAVVAQVICLELDNEKCEYVLHIANYGDRTISAEIRHL